MASSRTSYPKTTTSQPDSGPLGRNRWLIVLAVFGAAVCGVNLLLPFPDINDFHGLALICLMMERHGLRYAVNQNWGFAGPLS